MKTQKLLLLILCLLALSLMAAQCGGAATVAPPEPPAAAPGASGSPDITVSEPFASATIPNGAVYLTLSNPGEADDALVSVQTEAAASAELHESKMDENEVMRMSPLSKIELPAGQSVTLAPGGMHVMLLGLKDGIAVGDKINLTLNFEHAAPQTIAVDVTEGITMAGEHDMEHAETAMADEHDMEHAEMATSQPGEATEGDMAAMDHSEHDAEASTSTEHDHDETGDPALATASAPQPQVFQVGLATYLLDTAGLHAIDERLNGQGQIEAGDAGLVSRVNQVVAVTDWPADLNPQADQLQSVLTQYADALGNDDLAAAKPLATEAHEAQHDLSHAVQSWPGTMEGDSGPDQSFQMAAAAYLLDTAGLHAMDERLNGQGQIEAGDAGVVNRVNRIVAVTDWPADLNPQAEQLQTVLAQYADALSNDDLDTAKRLAAETHQVQHTLSQAIEAWLANTPAHADMMNDNEQSRQFQVTVAAYLMDMAGFHALDERLNDQGQIEAGDAGMVNRVNRVLAVVAWPAELKAQAEQLESVLAQYADALGNDDLDTAQPLATEAHEAQHDLSHAIGSWLGGDDEHGETHEHDAASEHDESETHEHDEAPDHSETGSHEHNEESDN
ncbi:MAG: copper chaperone PCu(A)C [Anaerolineae bacterium]|nr:copper chaperone PCu(A)C [Anaerolineae bacterium]